MIFEEAPNANDFYHAIRVSVCTVARRMSNDLAMNSPYY